MVIRADIVELVQNNDKFLITTHISPDGDGIGSALALSRGLKTLGKKAIIVDHSPTPSNLKFLLEDDSEIIQPAALPRGFNPEDHFALVVDMGAFDRLGSVLPIIRKCRGMLVIDHHIVEIPEGVHSLIDPSACATGEVIYNLLKSLGLQITRQIAEPLYAAIETDTGGFRFAGTSAATHLLASELLAAGVDPAKVYSEIYEKQSALRLRLTGEVLSTLWVSPQGKVATIELTQSLLKKLNARIEDGDDLVNHLMTIDGVEAGFYFKELGSEKTKVSCRSRNGLNLGEFLSEWGGGGHAFAAGLLIERNIASSKRAIIDKALRILEE